MSTDLDQQIQRLADLAFAQTDPVATPVRPSRSPQRWLVVAAGLLVVLMTLALITVRRGPDDVDLVDTSTGLSVESAFAEIPLTALDSSVAGSVVTAVDLDEIAELTSIERGDLVGLDDDWGRLILCGSFTCDPAATVALPLTDIFAQAIMRPEVFESELGWAGGDVASTVSWSNITRENYPIQFDVFQLDSDLSTLSDRAGEDAIIDVGEGEDFEINVEDTSPLRVTGRPRRIGVDPSRSSTAVSQSTPAVAAWLSSPGDSMATDPLASELARSLDETGNIYAFEATFGDFQVPAFDDGEFPDTLGFTIDDIVINDPFTALGVGWSGIGETQRTSIVYVFESEAAAADAVETIAGLCAPDADFIDFGSTGETPAVGSIFEVDTVSSSGTSVTVVGRAATGAGPWDVLARLQRPSPLALHR